MLNRLFEERLNRLSRPYVKTYQKPIGNAQRGLCLLSDCLDLSRGLPGIKERFYDNLKPAQSFEIFGQR